ncbi:MAG: hypothetical protein HYT83_00245 [Candidatus Levybacteria bacterium]|nr:hypothetical protein [Candidatus Levybacteria bacterium]
MAKEIWRRLSPINQPSKLQLPELVNMPEINEFPNGGHTLIVDAIGPQAVEVMNKFLTLLQNSGGAPELLGVAAFNVHPQNELAIARTIKQPINPLRRTPVVVNDHQEATLEFADRSLSHGRTARAALHFITYAPETREVITETCRSYSEHMPNIQDIGVVILPAESISRRKALREMQRYPLYRLTDLMPVIFVDLDAVKDDKSGQTLSRQDAFLHGLAGLVASHRIFPWINPDNYLDVIRELKKESRFIGAGVAVDKVPLIPVLKGLRKDIPQNDFASNIGQAIFTSLAESALITSLRRKPGSQLYISIAQLPLHPKHPYYKKSLSNDVKGEVQERFEELQLPIPAEHVQMLGYTKMPEIKDRKTSSVPIVALTLFPGELVLPET